MTENLDQNQFTEIICENGGKRYKMTRINLDVLSLRQIHSPLIYLSASWKLNDKVKVKLTKLLKRFLRKVITISLDPKYIKIQKLINFHPREKEKDEQMLVK